ncbi:hypothetical protein M758_1G210800 [Ceratodon purpureus]|uniref:Uncharacterized protein n=1 Tax=Ceratodon purpureus TaxID=3225 RepID=A0A8T0J8S5_CERPU|nr:hypothetical protein KC19_1G210900 [Ceratodon purpureus]KAG0630881.1 hypothetical protein M758_1G210800 [Ceratodon purpureus]
MYHIQVERRYQCYRFWSKSPCAFGLSEILQYADQSRRRRSTAYSFIDFSYYGVITRIRFGIDVGLVKMMELTGQSMDAILFSILLSKMIHSLFPSALAMMFAICFDHAHPPV